MLNYQIKLVERYPIYTKPIKFDSLISKEDDQKVLFFDFLSYLGIIEPFTIEEIRAEILRACKKLYIEKNKAVLFSDIHEKNIELIKTKKSFYTFTNEAVKKNIIAPFTVLIFVKNKKEFHILVPFKFKNKMEILKFLFPRTKELNKLIEISALI